ncbi:S41 family peptidase, partial [Patescibacteria group bacterium]|nr:S41 family peptidase [Patescibacteria group bacterium]
MFKKKTFLYSLAIVIIIAAVSAGFYLGWRAGRRVPLNIQVEGVGSVANQASTTADFGIFWQTWQLINSDYLNNAQISDQTKIYGAVNGLVNSLGDPYSEFFNPSDSQKFQEDVQGSFSGIGAQLSVKNGQIIIVSPLKDSPAQKAGLKSGDQILQINGTSTANMNINDAVELIRGESGTTVTLTILRSGWDKPQDFKIVRANIDVPTLDYSMKDGNIAYVHLYAFNENTDLLFYQAMVKALTGGAKGLVLDLRDNPGGYLQTAVDMSGWFLKRGSVVVTEAGRGLNDVYRANGNEALVNFPTVVIINGGSASAAEILSGALHDNRGIKLVGEQSFGKGTVQELVPLSGGSSIKLTIAHWILPNGQILEGHGLMPDVAVPLTDNDIKNNQDPQFDFKLNK